MWHFNALSNHFFAKCMWHFYAQSNHFFSGSCQKSWGPWHLLTADNRGANELQQTPLKQPLPCRNHMLRKPITAAIKGISSHSFPTLPYQDFWHTIRTTPISAKECNNAGPHRWPCNHHALHQQHYGSRYWDLRTKLIAVLYPYHHKL